MRRAGLLLLLAHPADALRAPHAAPSRRPVAQPDVRQTARALPPLEPRCARASSTRRAVLGSVAAITALGPASAAHAAYGAAQGAVTSLPSTNFERKSYGEQLDELEKLNTQNRAKKISALSEKDVEEVLRELDARQVQLSGKIQEDVTAMIASGETNRRLRDRLANAREDLAAANRKVQQATKAAEADATAQASAIASLDTEAQRQAKVVKDLEAELVALELKESSSGKLREQEFSYELRELRERLARLRGVRDSLLKRNTLLEALDAQPEWFNYAAAFLGSCVSTLVMHPVDTFKTRLIASRAKRPEGDGGEAGSSGVEVTHMPSCPLEAKNRPTFGGGTKETSDCIAQAETAEIALALLTDEMPATTKDKSPAPESTEEQAYTPIVVTVAKVEKPLVEPTPAGFLSLYQGLPGALMKEGPPSALYLGVYEAVKVRLLETPTFEPYPILVYLIAGAVGEVIGSIVRAPAENIKARVQSGADPSSLESLRRVVLTQEGRSNVVRAWSVSLFRDVPFGAVQLAIFEAMKAFLLDSDSALSEIDGLALEALLGAIGGACGALITTPPDVIALRILTQPTGEGQKPVGSLEMAKRIWAEDGFGAFWTGWQARTLYWAPAIGIFLSCYCTVRQAAVSQGLFQ